MHNLLPQSFVLAVASSFQQAVAIGRVEIQTRMRRRRRMGGNQANAGYQRIAAVGLTAKPQCINSRSVRSAKCELIGPGPIALHKRRGGHGSSILVLEDTF